MMEKVTKKRLKEIKKHLDFIQFDYDRQGYISTNTADELIEYSKYLIEKVEQLQQENERLKKSIIENYVPLQNLKVLDAQLHQAQVKVERYEKALKKINEYECCGFHWKHKEIVKQALEG
jgi:hypothetical protein